MNKRTQYPMQISLQKSIKSFYLGLMEFRLNFQIAWAVLLHYFSQLTNFNVSFSLVRVVYGF